MRTASLPRELSNRNCTYLKQSFEESKPVVRLYVTFLDLWEEICFPWNCLYDRNRIIIKKFATLVIQTQKIFQLSYHLRRKHMMQWALCELWLLCVIGLVQRTLRQERTSCIDYLSNRITLSWRMSLRLLGTNARCCFCCCCYYRIM